MVGEEILGNVDEFDLAIEKVRNLLAHNASGLTGETKNLVLVSQLEVALHGFEINEISIERPERIRGFRIPLLARGHISPEIDLVVTGGEQQYQKAAPWSKEMTRGHFEPNRYRFTFETDSSGNPTRFRSMRFEYRDRDWKEDYVWRGYGVRKGDSGLGSFCTELLKTIPEILTSRDAE